MDLGDVNSDLNRLEEECESSIPYSSITSHMLVVHGALFGSVNFPYCHFATDTLFPTFTSDGAPENGKFYQVHRPNNKELTYKTENPYRKGVLH